MSPTGGILCSALVACRDSSIRMVSNLMGIEFLELEVKVTATLDIRSTDDGQACSSKVP